MMKSPARKRVLIALLISLLLLFSVGCGGRTAAPPADKNANATLRPLRIAYQGLTCEAPTYIAYEKGFFAEEGFDVEMVKGDFNFIRDSFAAGRIDAVAGLALTWIKPLEQGVNAKVTAALHKGCLYAYTLAESGIEKVEDLKGKRIGVPAIGGAPMMLLARDLASKGIDIKEVEWRAFPVAELELALDKGEVDAVAVGEPFGTTFALNLAKFRVLLNQSVHAPYHEEYCCLWLIDGDLVENEPEVAAAITRAVLRAAQYVENNPVEVGAIIVEKGYVLGTAELNGQILEALEFVPSVAGAREALYISFEAGKEIGVIDAATDVTALTDKAFIQLPGLQ